jgi:hypothetical protein
MRTEEGGVITEYEIREALQDVLLGEVSLAQFREWLAKETWELEPGDNATVLANRIKLKLAEHTSGDLDDEELIVALKEISQHISSDYQQVVAVYGTSSTTVGTPGGSVTQTRFASAGR